MSRQPRYQRTERPRRIDQTPDIDPDVEQFEEDRGRYGTFPMYMAVFLAIAAVAAIVGTIVFWPDF